MPVYTAAAEVEPEWAPLERVSRLLAMRSDLPSIDPGDFMYMWRFEARGRADIHLYKHIDTRRYLNLDDAGHAHVYARSARDRPDGRMAAVFQPLGNLRTAIARLQLDLIRQTERASVPSLLDRRSSPPNY